ncbi:MAG: [protein-PII] uridylyltransferase [Mariprofundaceae bacterium]
MADTELKQMARQRRELMLKGAQRRLNARQDGRSIVKYMSREVDALLLDLWARIAGPRHGQIDLIAVGGYGRAELCPQSDWDLLFLHADGHDKALLADVERLLYVLWDIGAQIGHAVRTPVETLEHAWVDHHARTGLLESRLLVGEGGLYAQVRKGAQQHWSKRQRKSFCEQKMEECAARRKAMGDTAFLMEPDIKSGKGGLRDVSTVFWLSMAWYGVAKARELIRPGVVTEAEFNGFVRARNFLWRVRTGLHLLAGREDDRLRFEYQQELAESFGFRDSHGMRAVERFMKTYFRHVRTVADLSDIFLLHFDEQIHPRRLSRSRELGNGMVLRAGKVGVGDAVAFVSDPLNMLRIFLEAQQDNRYLDSKALRVIRHHAGLVDARLRASKQANEIFLTILRSRRNVATILRQMHETDVLGRFIPDFGRITSHGQFDRYHSYTVDTHTIRAIDILRDFYLGESRFVHVPLAKKLMLQMQRPELLYLALMFHDIAKGRGGDHAELGEQLARKFCRRLGLSRDDGELVAWLVLHHLTMSRTAQHFDLSDPEVIADFSRLVGDQERLIYLFLLTVADIAAVGPGVWTDWKGSLLSELFESTSACLRSGQVKPADYELRLSDRRESVLAMCDARERPALKQALASMPAHCLLHFPPEPLLGLSRMLFRDVAGTRIQVDEGRGCTQVLTWGNDRENLFSHLTATLAGANATVLSAQAYSLNDGRVLNEFYIIDHRNHPISESRQIDRLRQRLLDVQHGGEPLRQKRKIKSDVLMQSQAVRVRRLNEAAKRITAIELVAADRLGLLADLSLAISGLEVNLLGANISTFGEKVVDVFFLTDRMGGKLDQTTTEAVMRCLQSAAQLEQ